MASFNCVHLIGNLTRDPELKTLQSGMSVCEFGVAVNKRRKQQDGSYVDEPCFVNCTAWAKTAELINQYLTKGSPVFIDGELKLDTWEKDGQKRSQLKVVVNNVQFLQGKDHSQPPRQEQPQKHQETYTNTTVDDNVPF